VHYELLPPGQIITEDLFTQQLKRVQQARKQNEPALVNHNDVLLFFADNIRPQVVRVARDTIQQIGWKTLWNLTYSPDLAPTNYHFFPSLGKLCGKTLYNQVDLP